jgi:fructokinase
MLPDQTILGGAPFNFAYRVRALGHDSSIVSSLGTDRFGDRAYEAAVKLGVDTTLVQRTAAFPTGTVKIWFDEHKNPDFTIIPGVAYDNVEITEELLAAVAEADCLCFGTLAQRAKKSRETLYALLEAAGKALKFYDINLRKECYSRETIAYSLDRADVLKLNEDEARELAKMFGVPTSLHGFCSAMIDRWSLSQCLVTLGDKGVYAESAAEGSVYLRGYKVRLADSLGSGDAFSAAFVDATLRGEPFCEACQLGNMLGALTATHDGATPSISRDEIEAFRNSPIERTVHPAFV